MSDELDSVEPEVAWPPTRQQIEAWLGGFSVESYREVIGYQPGPGAPDDAADDDEEHDAGLLAALVDLARHLLLQSLGEEPPASEYSSQPVVLRRVVVANGEGLHIRGCQMDETVRWLDIERISGDDHNLWLSVAGGTDVWLPREPQLEPLWRTARQVVGARARREGALAERMERGLSRPEGDEQADRGLSAAEE